MLKKVSCFVLSTLLIVGLCACGAPATVEKDSSGSPSDSGTLLQLEEPAKGTPLVTLHTSMGDITMMLFPEQAPKAVENFLTHCKAGYYDGVLFHRVMEDFMIQGGDPEGTGSGGASIWDESFEDEFSNRLHHYRGALSMANRGTNTNGSQFFIVQSSITYGEEAEQQIFMTWLLNELQRQLDLAELSGKSEEELNALEEELNGVLTGAETSFPEEYAKRYEAGYTPYATLGGTPGLDYKHTVFGQVTEGMDVVDAIAAVEVVDDGAGNITRPAENVLIESVTVSEAK